ncbi:MAG: hypothetical protein IJD77_01435 [Clostridia bacterium]|nr:hypothetical protein [Clostridia bacterium]
MKIEKENLVAELKEALSDVFVAKIVEKEESLQMEFLNGQVFELLIKEN